MAIKALTDLKLNIYIFFGWYSNQGALKTTIIETRSDCFGRYRTFTLYV